MKCILGCSTWNVSWAVLHKMYPGLFYTKCILGCATQKYPGLFYTKCILGCSTRNVSWAVLQEMYPGLFYTKCILGCSTQNVSWAVLHEMYPGLFYTKCILGCSTQNVSWAVLHEMYPGLFYTKCILDCSTRNVSWAVPHKMYPGLFYTKMYPGLFYFLVIGLSNARHHTLKLFLPLLGLWYNFPKNYKQPNLQKIKTLKSKSSIWDSTMIQISAVLVNRITRNHQSCQRMQPMLPHQLNSGIFWTLDFFVQACWFFKPDSSLQLKTNQPTKTSKKKKKKNNQLNFQSRTLIPTITATLKDG